MQVSFNPNVKSRQVNNSQVNKKNNINFEKGIDRKILNDVTNPDKSLASVWNRINTFIGLTGKDFKKEDAIQDVNAAFKGHENNTRVKATVGFLKNDHDIIVALA